MVPMTIPHHDQSVWHPKVIQISALQSQGVDTFWDSVHRIQEPADRPMASWPSVANRRPWPGCGNASTPGFKQAFKSNPAVKCAHLGVDGQVASGAARHAASQYCSTKSAEQPSILLRWLFKIA